MSHRTPETQDATTTRSSKDFLSVLDFDAAELESGSSWRAG